MVDVAGIIDWKAIYAARKEAGIKYWFVEHDQPADPMASLAASCRYERAGVARGGQYFREWSAASRLWWRPMPP
jgi:hypothetical protein